MTRRRGSTLIETLVYCALFTLVGSGVATTYTIGNRYYMTSRSIVTAQQDAAALPRKLAQELMESHLTGITFYPNSISTSSARGVVFISPHNPANGDAFSFNQTSGNTRWYKYVCYYLGTDPSKSTSLAVIRKEYVPAGLNPDASPVQCSYDTTWFSTNTALRADVVAHDVTSGGFSVYSGSVASPNYDTVTNPICIAVQTTVTYQSANNSVQANLSVSVRN